MHTHCERKESLHISSQFFTTDYLNHNHDLTMRYIIILDLLYTGLIGYHCKRLSSMKYAYSYIPCKCSHTVNKSYYS